MQPGNVFNNMKCNQSTMSISFIQNLQMSSNNARPHIIHPIPL
uniref:Uncharacterized protein n=1 Tax=Rhizophora mucronata TaxID=61149 RepID=A0A2P2Q1E0_RHIMU